MCFVLMVLCHAHLFKMVKTVVLKIYTMKRTILILSIFLIGKTLSAQTMKLNAIIDSITVSHPLLKMYENEIRSMDEAAKGAKSWMPPPECGRSALLPAAFITPWCRNGCSA